MNKYTKLLDFLECEVTRNTYREIVALLSSRRIRKFVYDGERYLMLRESINMPVRIFETVYYTHLDSSEHIVSGQEIVHQHCRPSKNRLLCGRCGSGGRRKRDDALFKLGGQWRGSGFPDSLYQCRRADCNAPQPFLGYAGRCAGFYQERL